MSKIKIFIIMMLLVFFPSMVMAAEVVATLSWCRNMWPDLDGYTIKTTSPSTGENNYFFGKDEPISGSSVVTCIDSEPIHVVLLLKNFTHSEEYKFQLGINDTSNNWVWFSTVVSKKFPGTLEIPIILIRR